MQKQVWLLSVLSIIIVILIGILIFVPAKQSKNIQPVVAQDIQITSPKANEEISSPVKIIGVVNGNGWSGFEGQVGTVTLVDEKGKDITEGVLGATTDWTKLPTSFETTLNFASFVESAHLHFKNENPSGDPSRDKTFDLDVNIK